MIREEHLSGRSHSDEDAPPDDGMANLRRFMAILREWDREDRMEPREQRGRALARRCFTGNGESD